MAKIQTTVAKMLQAPRQKFVVSSYIIRQIIHFSATVGQNEGTANRMHFNIESD